MFRVVKNISAVLFCLLTSFATAAELTSRPPNFIVIMTDDQGYGDLGVYGSPNIKTPNIDTMASEGLRFTSFYAAPFCGPSRAALMTGSYPPRNSLAFNHGPDAKTGMHPNEITIAEVLKQKNYATMHIGKWHLGDAPEFMPRQQGFDAFFGMPYSHDMWAFHPNIEPTEGESPQLTAARQHAMDAALTDYYSSFWPKGTFSKPLPLIHNGKVLETDPDARLLTKRYTEQALRFIKNNHSQPFFLYLAHPMPHVPVFASEQFKGKSERGLYGDVVEEIDWSVGQILQQLKTLGIDDNTLVIFTSDNGPWLEYGFDGGSAGPLRAGKATVYEGGVRVPTIARWPKHIPANQRTSAIAANMDLLPTFARLADVAIPKDRVLDGRDIGHLLANPSKAQSPHKAFYYFSGRRSEAEPINLRAIRMGRWKLHLTGCQAGLCGKELYDLNQDVSERHNRVDHQADIVSKLEFEANRFNNQLAKSVRPLGVVGEPHERAISKGEFE